MQKKSERRILEMKKETNDSIIMTVDEVADYLKLSKITVYKLTQKGEIPGFRIGSSWRYNRQVIDEIARVGTKKIA
jgi:excisionase family DNA binding protein